MVARGRRDTTQSVRDHGFAVAVFLVLAVGVSVVPGAGAATTEPSAAEPATTATASEPATSEATTSEATTSEATTSEAMLDASDAAPSSASVSSATASSVKDEKTAPPAPRPHPYGERPWSVTASASYIGETESVNEVRIDPHGFGLGAMATYTFGNGVYLGVSGGYFFGSSVQQSYTIPLTTITVPLTATSSLVSVSAELGYDERLGPFVLRYALGLGISITNWDYGDIPLGSVDGVPGTKGSSVGPHMIPGIGILWPIDAFVVGAELRYRVELGDRTPKGFGGGLIGGVRF